MGLVDVLGRPITVERVEDHSLPLPPVEFWSRVPAAPTDPATAGRSLWSYPLLRRQLAAVDVSTPGRVSDFHRNLRRLDPCLGVDVDIDDPDARVVIAADIAHTPPATAHPLATGSYSRSYYPRRIGDWLNQDFIPASLISGEESIANRLNELLEFAHYSQYDEEGQNGFVADHDPGAHCELHLSGRAQQWAGGWDYVFDWSWLDSYGYQWQLHEPDHHVNSDIAVAMVRAYEATGDLRHLAAAELFVERQIPRYGWHTGLWRDRRYYWTEYGPSGPGHPDRDATVNIQALVARAVAMTGFYADDRRRLEYARGLLWYCIREWVSDGRWYYDGAENPVKTRAAISHDLAVLLPLLGTLPYLLRAGIALDEELGVLTEAYEYYLDHLDEEPLLAVRSGQLAKLRPERIDGEDWQVTSFFTANRRSTGMIFRDLVPSETTELAALPVRIETFDWNLGDPTVGADHGRMIMTNPTRLRAGLELELRLQPGDLVRISYPVHTTSDLATSRIGPSAVEVGTWEAGGVRHTRRVSAAVADPDLALAVTSATYLSTAARLSFPLGPER